MGCGVAHVEGSGLLESVEKRREKKERKKVKDLIK